MRILVAAVGALAVAGCAAASPKPPAAPPSAVAAPHPIVAEATEPPPLVNPQVPVKDDHPADDEHSPSHEHQTRQVNRAWGWAAVAVGADAAILATITSFMMLHQNSVRNANCQDKVCNSDGIAANGKLHDLSGWNAGGWIVGVAGLGAGVFLLVTNPTDRSLGTQVGVGPTGSGSGLLMRGSF